MDSVEENLSPRASACPPSYGTYLPTLIWRHPRENLKKCSLSGLEDRTDFHFLKSGSSPLPDFSRYILLRLDAPPLCAQDSSFGLFLIDATWRYAERMLRTLAKNGFVPPPSLYRSLPAHYITAYPRRQEGCLDPKRGLASIEALFVAYHILGRSTEGLFDRYYWKELFLQRNRPFLSSYSQYALT